MPEIFRFLTAGESHGEALTAVIDGVPAGLALTERFPRVRTDLKTTVAEEHHADDSSR